MLPTGSRASSFRMSFLRTWLAWLIRERNSFCSAGQTTNQWQNKVGIPLVMALQAGNEVLQQTQNWAGKAVEIQNPSMFWLTISLLSPLSHTGLWAFLWTRYKRFTTGTGVGLFAVDCKIEALPLSFGTPSQCSLSNHAWKESTDKSRCIPCPVLCLALAGCHEQGNTIFKGILNLQDEFRAVQE